MRLTQNSTQYEAAGMLIELLRRKTTCRHTLPFSASSIAAQDARAE